MRHLLFSVFFAANCVVGSPAIAQDTTETAAMAEADRLIAQADAADLFANTTVTDVPSIVHKPSGLGCVFEQPHSGNRLDVAPRSMPAGRSEAFRCQAAVLDFRVYTYASACKANGYEAERQAILELIEGDMPPIRRRLELPARPLTVQAAPSTGRTNVIRAIRYDFDPAQDVFVIISSTEIGGWVMLQMAVAPLETEADSRAAIDQIMTFAVAKARLQGS